MKNNYEVSFCSFQSDQRLVTVVNIKHLCRLSLFLAKETPGTLAKVFYLPFGSAEEARHNYNNPVVQRFYLMETWRQKANPETNLGYLVDFFIASKDYSQQEIVETALTECCMCDFGKSVFLSCLGCCY